LEDTTMANPRMTLLDLLSKAEQGADAEFLRDGLKLLAQELMDAEVSQLVGAGLHERAETRLTYRNGYREREWDTRVGTIELDIPKLRAGSYFPSLLEPRRDTRRRCSRWSRRPTSMASAPATSTLWLRRWASRASPRTR
jgi:transposase-like protein